MTSIHITRSGREGGPVIRLVAEVEDDGLLTPLIEVEVYRPDTAYGAPRGTRISWPSTSDKRPIVAKGLQAALAQAISLAEQLNEQAAEDAASEQFADREPGSVSEGEYQEAFGHALEQLEQAA